MQMDSECSELHIQVFESILRNQIILYILSLLTVVLNPIRPLLIFFSRLVIIELIVVVCVTRQATCP